MAQLNSVTWPYDFFQISKSSNDYGSKLVELAMPTVLAHANLTDYRYAGQRQINLAAAVNEKIQPLKEKALLSTPVDAVVNFKTSATLKLNLPKSLAPESDKTRVILELTVSYKSSPRGRYEVFVSPPKSIAKDDNPTDEKYYVGAISFFVHDPQEKGGSQTFRYDITDELLPSNGDTQDVEVSIIKTFGPDKSVITINKAVVKTLE